MNIDFDRLRQIYLGGGDTALYKEKEKLLQEFLQSLPEDKKQLVIEYDKKICSELVGLTPEERLLKISKMIQEKLFDLTDAWLDLANHVKGTDEADFLIKKLKNSKSDF